MLSLRGFGAVRVSTLDPARISRSSLANDGDPSTAAVRFSRWRCGLIEATDAVRCRAVPAVDGRIAEAIVDRSALVTSTDRAPRLPVCFVEATKWNWCSTST